MVAYLTTEGTLENFKRRNLSKFIKNIVPIRYKNFKTKLPSFFKKVCSVPK